MALLAPLGLLAELTHRCPLGCPYCSNPLELEPRSDELDTATWARVFREAAALGVLQTHISGGEPLLRRDVVEIVASAHAAGLYTNLITSALGLTEPRLRDLADAGLDHVQISFQDSASATADYWGHRPGASQKKHEAARLVVAMGLPLTANCVIHRGNIGRIGAMVEMAAGLGASRVEIAHTQYHGWALVNRAALMPSRAQTDAAAVEVEQLRRAYHGRLVIDAVMPDYHSGVPKPCLGGWARRSLNVTPTGLALPCHAAQTIPGLEFWSVRDHSVAAIWRDSPAFTAFRGTAWMKEPCASCPRREIDFGGCRCQAMALTGDARATDPACSLSPDHAVIAALADRQDDVPFEWRRDPADDRTRTPVLETIPGE